jgi:hypothetical protein
VPNRTHNGPVCPACQIARSSHAQCTTAPFARRVKSHAVRTPRAQRPRLPGVSNRTQFARPVHNGPVCPACQIARSSHAQCTTAPFARRVKSHAVRTPSAQRPHLPGVSKSHVVRTPSAQRPCLPGVSKSHAARTPSAQRPRLPGVSNRTQFESLAPFLRTSLLPPFLRVCTASVQSPSRVNNNSAY